MAADGYLKAAAAQLQSAAQAIKMQIDQIRSSAMTSENQLQHDIDKNESEMRALAGRQSLSHEPASAGELTIRLAKLRAENESKKQQLAQIQSQTSQAIRAKEGAMNDVVNEAKTLENKAGNPALR